MDESTNFAIQIWENEEQGPKEEEIGNEGTQTDDPNHNGQVLPFCLGLDLGDKHESRQKSACDSAKVRKIVENGDKTDQKEKSNLDQLHDKPSDWFDQTPKIDKLVGKHCPHHARECWCRAD